MRLGVWCNQTFADQDLSYELSCFIFNLNTHFKQNISLYWLSYMGLMLAIQGETNSWKPGTGWLPWTMVSTDWGRSGRTTRTWIIALFGICLLCSTLVQNNVNEYGACNPTPTKNPQGIILLQNIWDPRGGFEPFISHWVFAQPRQKWQPSGAGMMCGLGS